MKFFRCDMVFRTLMGRTETVCFDNYEQIWICKTLSPKQIMEEVDCLMEELEKYENKPFDIQNTLNTSMNTSVSIVISSLLFGKRFDYEDAIFKRLMVLINKLFATLSIDRVQKILGDIDAFTWEIINEHRRNFDENTINDFIDGFLLKQKNRRELKRIQHLPVSFGTEILR